MGTRQELAQAIYHDGCITFAGPGEEGRPLRKHKEYPNAPLSPHFVSLRTPEVKTHGGNGTLTQGTVAEIGRHLFEEYQARGLTARFIAPIPNAAMAYGDAMVAAAAEKGVELKIVRLIKANEGDGGGIGSVELGEWQPGDKVVLIDDLITAAGTKKDAVRVLREFGLLVTILLVVIDRMQGGEAEMETLGVTLVALLNFPDIVEMLAESGAITGYQHGRYDQYIHDDRRFNQEHGLPVY